MASWDVACGFRRSGQSFTTRGRLQARAAIREEAAEDNRYSDPMSEADPMEEMHSAPRFSVAEGRNQRLQLRACGFHVAVVQGFVYLFKPFSKPVRSTAPRRSSATR
jgi:hypothetical protein